MIVVQHHVSNFSALSWTSYWYISMIW